MLYLLLQDSRIFASVNCEPPYNKGNTRYRNDTTQCYNCRPMMCDLDALNFIGYVESMILDNSLEHSTIPGIKCLANFHEISDQLNDRYIYVKLRSESTKSWT